MTADTQHAHRPLRTQRLAALILAASSSFIAASANAQSTSDSATGQALFDRAKKLMKDHKYEPACPMLEESQRVDPRSGTLLNLADCYEHEDRLASAWTTFLEAATMAKAAGNADRESGARDRATALVPRLSNLVVEAVNADATPGLEITRDGEAVGHAQLGVPLPADAGKHVIAAKAPGRKPWQQEVVVKPGAATTSVQVPNLESDGSAVAAVSLPTAPSEATSDSATPAPSSGTSKSSHTGVIVGGVVTGVLAIGTVITAVLYNSKRHAYETANDTRADNRVDLQSQTRTLGITNLALLGGTVVAAGVTVFVWTRSSAHEHESAGVQLRGAVAPGFATLSLSGAL